MQPVTLVLIFFLLPCDSQKAPSKTVLFDIYPAVNLPRIDLMARAIYVEDHKTIRFRISDEISRHTPKISLFFATEKKNISVTEGFIFKGFRDCNSKICVSYDKEDTRNEIFIELLPEVERPKVFRLLATIRSVPEWSNSKVSYYQTYPIVPFKKTVLKFKRIVKNGKVEDMAEATFPNPLEFTTNNTDNKVDISNGLAQKELGLITSYIKIKYSVELKFFLNVSFQGKLEHNRDYSQSKILKSTGYDTPVKTEQKWKELPVYSGVVGIFFVSVAVISGSVLLLRKKLSNFFNKREMYSRYIVSQYQGRKATPDSTLSGTRVHDPNVF